MSVPDGFGRMACMRTPPETDSFSVGELESSFIGRIIEIEADGQDRPSLTGPIAEVKHEAESVTVSVGLPASELPTGEDPTPLAVFRFKPDTRVRIRRGLPRL